MVQSGKSWSVASTPNPKLQNEDIVTFYYTVVQPAGSSNTAWMTRTVGKNVPPANKLVSLFSLANNKFVCADNTGSSSLTANRTGVDNWGQEGWEQFRVIDLGGGKVALQSQANGMYVCAEKTGRTPLIANRPSAGDWEAFYWEPQPDGTVALKAVSNGKYISADLNKSNPPCLWATRGSVSAWEKFAVTFY